MIENLICDNFSGIRLVSFGESIYVQKEYMITGYNEDGEYNPCIATEWKNLSKMSNEYNKSSTFLHYIRFDSIHNAIKWIRNATVEEVGYSSVYTTSCGEYKVLETEQTIRDNYTEYFI